MIEALKIYRQRYTQGRGLAELLNDEGVCLALAMCFAHAHLITPSFEESPEVFEQFLLRWRSADGVRDFLQEYEQLKQDYEQARDLSSNVSAQDVARLEQRLKRMHTQCAYYDAAVLLYAEKSGKKQQYSIGLRPNFSVQAMQSIGLRPMNSGIRLSLSLNQLDNFFFPETAADASASPFAPGGTYLIDLPGHACAVHVNTDGQLTLYDPNAAAYIRSKEQLKIFKELCVSTYGVQSKKITDDTDNETSDDDDEEAELLIPITVHAVCLSKKELQSQNIVAIENVVLSQLDTVIAKNLEQYTISAESFDDLILDFWQNLFFTYNPECSDKLSFLLSDIGADADKRRRANDMAVFFFKSTNNTQMFQIILDNPHLTQNDFDRLITQACDCSAWSYHQEIQALLYLLCNVPEHIRLSLDNSGIELFLAKHLSEGHIDAVSEVLQVLFVQSRPSDKILKMLISHKNHHLSELAIVTWLRYQEKYDAPIQNTDLIAWLIKNKVEPSLISGVMRAQHYVISQQDYDSIINSDYHELKRLLCCMTAQQLAEAITPVPELMKALILDDKNLFEAELQRSFALLPVESQKRIVSYAIGHSDKTIVSALLSQDIDNSIKQAALQKAISDNKADVATFLYETHHIALDSKSSAEALWRAASANHWEVVALLAKQEEIINQENRLKKTPLLYAAALPDPKCLDILISYRADWSYKDWNGHSALMIAAKSSVPCVRALLEVPEQQAALEEGDKKGQTALMHAIAAGQIEAAKILIDAGARLDVVDKTGQSVLSIKDYNDNNILHQALRVVDQAFVRTILAQESLVISDQDERLKDTLIKAAQFQSDIFALVLQKLDPSSRRALLNNHDFLLTLIAQLDTKEKLRCLVNMGIELDGIQSSKGNTILEVIADDGSVAVFEELIEVLTHKKDDRISDLQEVFPENVLKSNKDKRDKIKLMINLGVSIESTDLFGQSALLLAVKDGDLQSIAVLLDAGANPDKKSYLGQTPLIISAQKLPLECFQSMLRHSELSQEGVRQDYKNIVLFAVLRSDIDKNEKLRAILKYYTNLEIRDENNQTPLVCALKQQESETIQMLISAGAKIELSHDLLVLLAYQSQAILQQAFSMQDFCSIINQPDTDGNTALIHAIKSSRDTVAKVWLLLESGADMTVSNHAGETAVLLALKYGHHEVLELFAAHRSQEYSALIAEIENESDVRSNYKIPAASQKKESLIFSESTKTASIPDRAISSSNQTGSV